MEDDKKKKIGWFEIVIIIVALGAVIVSYLRTYKTPNFTIKFSEETFEEDNEIIDISD